jgi:YVTN family beta-propeller protein
MATMSRWLSLTAATGLVWTLLLPRLANTPQTIATPPRRSSAALAITADGTRLAAVNPPANSLTLVQLYPALVVAEIAVGLDPRTVALDEAAGRAYVANRGSATISVVDLEAQAVVAEIPVGARPYGVVVSPDGRRLYVAAQGADRLDVVDTGALTVTQRLEMADRPSGLALTADGRQLFVTHLLRSHITVVTVEPYSLYLPNTLGRSEPLAPAGAGASGLAPASPTAIFLTRTLSLFPTSNLLQSIVLAPDGQRAYVPHTRSNSGNPHLTLDSTVFPLVSVVDVGAVQHLVGQQFDLANLDPPAVGLPFDAAFSPDGARLWIANAASNDVTVIDLAARQRLAHIEVGDNPRGIVLAPDGSRAYVNNVLAGTLSVVDTALFTVVQTITTTTLPADDPLLAGQRLFNTSDDDRMGQDQWMSCATCHFDGESDGRTWQLGFAGPRNTPSLAGLAQTYPLRRSGEWDEAADSEFAIRMDSFGTGLVTGPMLCSVSPPDCASFPPHAGLSADLDALAAYLDSLPMPLHPDHLAGEPLADDALAGQVLFLSPELGCAGCHPPPLYTDNALHDVGTATAAERVGPAFNTPSLRGLYDSAPYFHDGSAPSLAAAITRPSPAGEHDVSALLSAPLIEQLVAFLSVLPFE